MGGLIVHYQSLVYKPLYGLLMVMVAASVTLAWLIFEHKQLVK